MTILSLRQIDYLLLILGAGVLFGLLHFLFWRGRRVGAMAPITWLLVAGILGSGWFFVESTDRRERLRMQQMVEGYAPIYAQELQRMGHEQITTETTPDNPRYWQMIQAEKRWLAANPSISDVYTLRKLRDGHVVAIVNSETDYNHDGVFEGEREQRTKIGEVYASDALPTAEKALAGQPAFTDEACTDRCGQWVTAFVPLRDFKGNVEAVLGVDFDATTWMAAIHRARRMAIGYLGVLLLVIAGAGGLLAHQIVARKSEARERGRTNAINQTNTNTQAAASIEKQKPEALEKLKLEALEKQKLEALEKQKLETLVNSIDGIVWEADAAASRFTFVSRQCERLLGYTPEQWMAKDGFWSDKLHPDDKWTAGHCAQMIAKKEPFSCDYRMIAADGRTVWIRENAAVLLDAAGQPLLVRGVFYDITAQKSAAEELERANRALIDSSRHAGMAEVATGVLHNVGNVLNSVNISGNVISDRLRTSKVIELGKVSGLLTLQAADFIGFVSRDPRGKHIPELIACVAEALRAEHRELLEEVESITRNIGHIKEIVSMQQGFAKGAGLTEPLAIQTLVDDAIKINSIALSRHRISVVQAYEEVPKVLVDKHLILQIFVNLLRNAQQAITDAEREERRIVVRIQSSGVEFVKVAVQDTGGGIPAENLTRIFSHGFTTKTSGHGFGLHSSALAAAGMGGTLTAHSEGPGTGATFILELPVFNAVPTSVAA